ncbi:MAG: hypothetical protein KZQ91_02535 [Candidatus Thiodiazotropha sp. (ex Lucinoma borealis)]|nr:hypothetical protein [Candidatus Thiodiazotropha sp. (ex Lucinoma borealis)]
MNTIPKNTTYSRDQDHLQSRDNKFTFSRYCKWLPPTVIMLILSACGGGDSSGTVTPISNGDTDLDGLTDQQEETLGTDPNIVDTDNDRIWDGDEVNMFSTNPILSDTDNDGIDDGADPQPVVINTIPTDPNSGRFVEYGVFKTNATGSSTQRISNTRYEENHVVYAPLTASNQPLLIYQTYIEDTNSDTLFNEGDLTGSVIAIMNVDGTRPRYLTDIDPSNGMVQNNHSIDATPEPSPDGQYIIFVSDRDNPGSFQLKLYVMDIDGNNQTPLNYASNPPASDEIDADPFWGVDNKITFKRQQFISGRAGFSRVYTANIDTATMTLYNLMERTSGSNTPLSTPNGPGDFDPKISPDGHLIASYRHLSDSVSIFGDYDLWIGLYHHAEEPADSSITLFDQDTSAAVLFPRWNINGDKLAAWQLDGTALSMGMDAIDLVIYELDLTEQPFSFSATRTNITPNNDGWFETMPSWNTDPNKAEEIIYSASRQF